MKRFFALTVCIAAMAAVLALAACTAVFTPPAAGGEGSLTVRISGLAGERALIPLVSISDIKRYDLLFEPVNGNIASSKTINNAKPNGETVTLSEGDWKVTAKAYMYINGTIPRNGNVEIPAAVSAEPASIITVSPEGKANTLVLDIVLNPYKDPASNGYFTWKKDMFMVMSGNEAVTAMANKAILTINPLASSLTAKTEINLTDVDQTTANTGMLGLVPGSYTVSLAVEADGLRGGVDKGGITEVISIYSGMETKFPFDASDFLATRPLLGSIWVYSGEGLNNAPSARLTAKSYPDGATTYSTTTVTGANGSNLKEAAVPWILRVPMSAESAILEVEFLNPSNTVVYRDTRLATNIGGTAAQYDESNNLTGYAPKMEILTYIATPRTVSFWYGNTLYTLNPADNTMGYVNSGNTVSSGASYSIGSGGTLNTATFTKLFNSSTRAFYPGSMIWVEVSRSANYSISRFNATVTSSNQSFNLLSMFFGGDKTKSVYCIPLDITLDNNLRIDINFESAARLPRIVCYGDSITLGIGDGGEDSNNWLVMNVPDTTTNPPTPGFNIQKTYPWYLSQKLKSNAVTVINRGLEGNGTSVAVQGGVPLNGWNWETSKGESRESGIYQDITSLLSNNTSNSTTNPDVVIINLGINDFLPGYQNNIDSPVATMLHNYGIILREVCDGKRKVYVARFLTNQAMQDYLARFKYPVDRQAEIIAKFNEMYEWMKTFPNVKVIDIWDGVWGGNQEAGIALNGVHPNAAGYAKIADNIYNAIQADLPATWKN